MSDKAGKPTKPEDAQASYSPSSRKKRAVEITSSPSVRGFRGVGCAPSVSAFVDTNGKPRDYTASVPRKDAPVDKTELLKNPRYRILKEIKDSERTYLTFLQSVALLFLSPCKSSTSTASPILTPALIEDLFGNILEVVEISTQVLQAIEVLAHPQGWDSENSTVGDLFFELIDVRSLPCSSELS